jgi:hypothetical protein
MTRRKTYGEKCGHQRASGVLVVIEVATSRLLELASIVLVDLKIGGSLAVGRIHGVVTVVSAAIVVVGISPFGVRGCGLLFWNHFWNHVQKLHRPTPTE